MRNEFSELIKDMDKNLAVLDVGSGGQQGLNTTNYLLEHFDHVTGINIESARVDQEWAKDKEMTMIFADFYTYDFKEKFDLIVLDVGADQNKQELWFPRAMKLLKPNGYVINHVNFANLRPGLELIDLVHEERRNEMIWCKFLNL